MVRESDLNVIKKFQEKLQGKFNDLKIILFGSKATETDNENSDFDIIIVSDSFKDKDFLERGCFVRNDWNCNFPVDFICYTPEEFEERKSRVSLVSEALKSGVIIQ